MGRRWQGRGTAFAAKTTRLECTLLAYWGEGHQAPWLILTDVPPEAAEACWYGLRAWIEQGFKKIRLILGFEDMIKFKLCPLCACPPCAASTTSLMKENVTKKSDGSAGPTACVVRLARPTKSPSAVATTGNKNVADTPARTAENGLTTLPGPFSWGGISPCRCGSLTST